jgi:hypothetical protein
MPPARAALINELAAGLTEVAAARIFEDAGEAWTYGWCSEGYRRRPEAAIRVSSGRVRLPLHAVEAYERAMSRLLASPVSQRWEAEELWGIVAEMVATLPRGTTGPEEPELQRRMGLLLATSPSLVAFAVANIGWTAEPRTFADCVLGSADARFLKTLERAARGRPTVEVADRPWWMSKLWEPDSGEDAVVFAAWVLADGQRAIEEAGRRFEDILSVGLLRVKDPQDLGLTPLRGDSHKPGIRGLALHRPAFRGAQSLGRELGAEIQIASTTGRRLHVQWYGEDPLPLDRLIEGSGDIVAMTSIVTGATPVDRRLRTAARWLAKAHWAVGAEDAVLALGIALDAMLAEEGSSPGRILTERFAFLEADRAIRPSRAKRMDLLYRVRSSVAHGGRSHQLDQEGFVGEMAADVRWVARRLVELSGVAPLRTEADHAALFADLKWGIRSPG